MKRSRRSGFTLIEILIVIGIIGLLVTILVAALLSATGAGQEGRARHFVNNVIPEAMLQWQDYNGKGSNDYPRSPNLREGQAYIDGNIELYNELVTKPDAAGKGAFVMAEHYDKGESKGKPLFNDPWGTPYIYRNYTQKLSRGGGTQQVYRGKTHSQTYDVISCGPDMVLDTEDDIFRGK